MSQIEQPFANQSRVKIYVLKEDGNWMDYRVGYLSCHKDMNGNLFLRVYQTSSMNDESKSEENHSYLVQSLEEDFSVQDIKCVMNVPVHRESKYECQGENILTLQVPDEIALSFIDSQFLRETIQVIDQWVGRRCSQAFRFEHEPPPLIVPSSQNLDALQTQIQEHPSTFLQGMLSTPRYFEHFRRIFEEAEEKSNIHVLEQLYQIFRSLIYLKNEQILLMLMQESNYLITFGVLEWQGIIIFQLSIDHNDNKGQFKVNYRKFLKEKSRFHQVFEELEVDVLSAIHINYRLTYLKETVMAHAIFQEDPTYNFLMQTINQNNYLIINSLLLKHQNQLVNLLEQLPKKVIEITLFLNEFFQIFTRFQNNVEFRTAFAAVLKTSNFLIVLNETMNRVLIKLYNITSEESQMVCQTLLQIQLLYMNIEAQNFVDLFFSNNHQNTLNTIFWENLYNIMFNDQSPTHPLVSDTLLLLYPPPQQPNQLFRKSSDCLRGELLHFLKRCKSNTNLSDQSLTLYNQILMNTIMFFGNINDDLLYLCEPVLDWIGQPFLKNKSNLIQGVKLFRFLVSLDQKEASKYLRDTGVADRFLKFQITKRNEGVFEGLIRETVHNIVKNNTISRYICNKVPMEDPLRKSVLFESLFSSFVKQDEMTLSQSLPPPSPQTKQLQSNLFMREQSLKNDNEHPHKQLEEERRYYDLEPLQDEKNQEQQSDLIERRLKLEQNLKKKKPLDQEEDENLLTSIFQKRNREIEFQLQLNICDTIEKKVKIDDQNPENQNKERAVD